MEQFAPVDEQLDLLEKGAAEIIRVAELRERLEESRKTGRPLRVKAGFDPTAPDLHLGHTVLMRKLRHFQQLGHTVIFLVGDFTSLIGDPSGRNVTRKPLTRAEIDANAETYKQQVFRILDEKTTEVRYNSEWLGKLGYEETIRLTAHFTVSQMLERDEFHKRFQEEQPISLHELLYPVMQGYDSVCLECDVELGGTDQKFNLLCGRELQRHYGQKPQIVLMTPILEGTDGVQKMSKSLDNAIGINELPDEMYSKLMRISDNLMWKYYELLTDLRQSQLESLLVEAKHGIMNPMDAKKQLARMITADFHGELAAKNAEENWSKRVQQKSISANASQFSLSLADHRDFWMSGALPTGLSGAGGPVSLIKVPALLTYCRLASSNSEAQRKLKEGAVKINGAVWTKPVLPLENKGLQRIDGLLKWRLEIQLGRKQTIVTLG